MKDWKTLQQKIGPLRYQTSTSDCVPTTVISALLIVTKARLSPRLQKLIWNVSLDTEDGPTGWVTALLQAARELAPLMLDQHPALAERHVQRWLGGKAEFFKA